MNECYIPPQRPPLPYRHAPPDYYQRVMEGQLVFCANHIVFSVAGLEESFYPDLIANIASTKIASITNGSMFLRMTPQLWRAIQDKNLMFVVMELDTTVDYGCYTKARYTHIIPDE